MICLCFFFSSRRRHTRWPRDWSSDVCSSDLQELRKFIVNNLGNQYQFIEAKNGNQGVQLAQEFLPDLIISDIMMPELDGYSFAKIIKETTLTSHIPILLLTAKSEFNDKIKGLDRSEEHTSE